ncbi:MAG: RidA family protein [Haliscomenobacter sp.]|nr:RidA family protein [Haliscomenobacter sp.]MBK7475307.1 RidA family protein [Haliscomenobacter sp.]MBK8041441.1 RidA family protein [Haliscomenobacter sp.]MBK8654882.1 RidA family protein [Haliscomenobacter sp.]MBK8877904.1 RidA family protein [Haliscomenobacter sp.]
MQSVHSPQAPLAIGPYAQAIRSGNLLFCSGQTPLHPESMTLQGTTIEEQTQRVLQNLELVLEAAGVNRKSIVKTTVFLKNFADFDRMNAVYAAFFGEHRPARSTVEVSRLPKDALVEIECVAEVG